MARKKTDKDAQKADEVTQEVPDVNTTTDAAADETTDEELAEDMIEVKAKSGKGGPEVTITRSFGTNLPDAVERYGEEHVFTVFKRAAIIAVQNGMRNILKSEEGTAEQAIAAGLEWTPSIVRRGRAPKAPVDPKTVVEKALASGAMGVDELRALLEQRIADEAAEAATAE
jgi:hypothetical protein